ncbi:S-type pyocin domain-containing protein [Pseudomonas fluorescens]|uniref:S-type pyocin domain-containing protein n=1 Tax=Pseudomonas fluorescens TaxID=294 RepID=UPI002034D982|nr:S-type pyocin domain-containing protein [Pseudomonas fluorescens]
MRLMKSSAVGAGNRESSHAAETTVRKLLEQNSSSIEWRDELLRAHRAISTNQDNVGAVRRRDWGLVSHKPHEVGGGGFFCTAPEPDPVYIRNVPWPDPQPRTDQIFAKSISTAPGGTTNAGTVSEPVANVGKAMVLASSMAVVGRGKIAGDLILRSFVWSLDVAGTALKNADGPVGRVLIMPMAPTMLGDGWFYTEEQLHDMRMATTRVRFQFRHDSQGALQVYAIHTSAQSGPVVKAKWNADKSAMEAHLGTITIVWTQNNGAAVTAPSTYPGVIDELANIFIHPVSEGVDSKIEGASIDELKVEDCIITFPVGGGIKSLYRVFAQPMVNPREVGPANDLSSQSTRAGLDIDHMPAQRVLREYVLSLNPNILPKLLKEIL